MNHRLICFCMVLLSVALVAQESQPAAPPPQGGEQGQMRGRGMGMRFRGTGGTISAINGDTLTLQTREGGTVTVKTTDNTQVRIDGKTAKLSDLKVGDRIMVRGSSTGENSWTADMIGSNPAMEARMREGLGKEFVAGKVTAINGTNISVDRIDGQTQTISVDENTSFRKQRESITLADIKVGDQIFSRGAVKDGVFVASQLNVGGPGGMRMMGGPRQPPQQ